MRKKKEEFGCVDVCGPGPDSWLLGRVAPHSDKSIPSQPGITKTEDSDSGFDSLGAELAEGVVYGGVKQKRCLIQEDEEQEARLTRQEYDFRRQLGRV